MAVTPIYIPGSAINDFEARVAADITPGIQSTITNEATVAVLGELSSSSSGKGDSLITVNAPWTGAGNRTQHQKNADYVNICDFYANGTSGALVDPTGVTDSTGGILAAIATGLPLLIPYGNYLILSAGHTSIPIVINQDVYADGTLVVGTNFSGTAVQICNSVYGRKLAISRLNVYSTDVRPSPYTAAKTVGIQVGPTATYSGNTPCPGVTLYNCRATRFSINLQISTFNVTVMSGAYPQGDHNILVYSYDTGHNQINDVTFLDVQADSAASSVGQAYALRVGTIGNGVYTADATQGVNLKVWGCNFDGAPVFIDNQFGVDYRTNYHEQGAGYSYLGGALVLGNAGAGYLQNVHIDDCWFTQFDDAIVLAGQVTNLDIGINSYANIKYSALKSNVSESQSFRYKNGVALGNTNWAIGSGTPEVATNFSPGIAVGQLTFGGISIFNDYLTAGCQLAPTQANTTNWYPRGMTLDGWQSYSSVSGRFRSGAAIQTSIAGTQSGTLFTFTTPAQAKLFCGGDRITVSAGVNNHIKSVDYAAGTCVLNGSYSGAVNISHDPALFLGLHLTGSGSPEGVISAPVGSNYVSLAGGSSTTLYVKESGTGTSGWVGK